MALKTEKRSLEKPLESNWHSAKTWLFEKDQAMNLHIPASEQFSMNCPVRTDYSNTTVVVNVILCKRSLGNNVIRLSCVTLYKKH